jgi:hypothetical protein
MFEWYRRNKSYSNIDYAEGSAPVTDQLKNAEYPLEECQVRGSKSGKINAILLDFLSVRLIITLEHSQIDSLKQLLRNGSKIEA